MEVLDAVEDDHVPVLAILLEDVGKVLRWALIVHDRLEGRAAAHRVVHQRERLLHVECPFHLPQAVLGFEVPLGDEDHDDGGLLDVLLQGADVLARDRDRDRDRVRVRVRDGDGDRVRVRVGVTSRSSTSRKTDTPVSSKESCRLMVAHWSCPVPQMCERKRCHLCPLASARSGRLPVERRRNVGTWLGRGVGVGFGLGLGFGSG